MKPKLSKERSGRKPGPASGTAVRKRLLEHFRRGGYIRLPNSDRRKAEKSSYKKGPEVRLIVKDKTELREVRRLLREAGLRPGAPYARWSRIIQPVYSEAAAAFFLRSSGRDRRLHKAGGRAKRRSG